MSAHASHLESVLTRRFPRVNFVTPVEIIGQEVVYWAMSQNLSLGGMLMRTDWDFNVGEHYQLRFNLPTCAPISMPAKVVHCRPGSRVGVEFTECHNGSKQALEQAIKVSCEHHRRSPRVPSRVFVMLYWHGGAAERCEWAETALLSRQGCLVTSKLAPLNGESLIVWWGDRRRGIPARVVSTRPGDDDTSLVALEFRTDINFWDRDF